MATTTHTEGTPKHHKSTGGKLPACGPCLWQVLDDIGMEHLARLIAVKSEIAPRPGALVFVDARGLSCMWNGMQPFIFSAIDLCTQLQLARVYLTRTVASALDFLELIRQKFPFPIAAVCTRAEAPFVEEGSPPGNQRFAKIAADRGITHTVVARLSDEELIGAVSKMTFGGILEESIEKASVQTIMRELLNYLFFHNNHRSLPLLDGKTPLQRLKEFPGFERLHTYDPFAAEITASQS